MPTAQTQFDVGALRRAMADHDADAVAALYDEAAVVTMVDQDAPPSTPRRLNGRKEIAALWRDVLSRDMTHELRDEVVGDDRASYTIACRYADGTRVLGMVALELRDGKITSETGVQAWDR